MEISYVVALIVIGTAIAGIWFRIETAINKAKKEAIDHANATIIELRANVNKAAEAAINSQMLISLHEKNLYEHKLHVAETFVTKNGLREFRDEVMSGIRDIKSTMGVLHERVDRVLENELKLTKEMNK